MNAVLHSSAGGWTDRIKPHRSEGRTSAVCVGCFHTRIVCLCMACCAQTALAKVCESCNRCAPNHGGRAAGLPRVVLALGHEFQTHLGILSLMGCAHGHAAWQMRDGMHVPPKE